MPGLGPRSPANQSPSKAPTTPKKSRANGSSADDLEATPTPKRKRNIPKQVLKSTPEGSDEDTAEDIPPKRTKVKAIPKPKFANNDYTVGDKDSNANKHLASPSLTPEPTTTVKDEPEDDNPFFDAQEHFDNEEEVADYNNATHESRKSPSLFLHLIVQNADAHSCQRVPVHSAPATSKRLLTCCGIDLRHWLNSTV